MSVAAAALICLVVGVTDGDTIKVRCGEPGAYEEVKVRLGAIDAPEKKQAFGQRSRDALAQLCFEQDAQTNKVSRDRYGRTVADVKCQEQDVGQFMVSNGLAWVYDKYAKGYGHLYPMQDAARVAHRGLWADDEPTPPWLFRKRAKK